MGMLFKLDPVVAPKQPAGPCEEGTLKDLYNNSFNDVFYYTPEAMNGTI